jgi:predicted ester cyclase
MANPGKLEASERYMAIAQRWFTEGWTGNLAMADEIFGEELRTNGVRVGVAGPVARIRDRLIGFPDLTTSIEDMFISGDKLAVTLMWRGTHTGPYGGPVHDAEADRVPPRECPRRLTGEAAS